MIGHRRPFTVIDAARILARHRVVGRRAGRGVYPSAIPRDMKFGLVPRLRPLPTTADRTLTPEVAGSSPVVDLVLSACRWWSLATGRVPNTCQTSRRELEPELCMHAPDPPRSRIARRIARAPSSGAVATISRRRGLSRRRSSSYRTRTRSSRTCDCVLSPVLSWERKSAQLQLGSIPGAPISRRERARQPIEAVGQVCEEALG